MLQQMSDKQGHVYNIQSYDVQPLTRNMGRASSDALGVPSIISPEYMVLPMTQDTRKAGVTTKALLYGVSYR